MTLPVLSGWIWERYGHQWVFLLAGAIYFLLAWPLSLITRRVEVRMRRGLRAAGP